MKSGSRQPSACLTLDAASRKLLHVQVPRKSDRTMKYRTLAAAALSAALLAISAPGAMAADWIGRKPAAVPIDSPCGDARALNRISKRFDHQVRHVPGLPPVAILAFHDIRQQRFLPAHEDNPIARLYCNATVALTDGQSRKLWYLIEYGQGFASIGDNVEFCVSGFDRWNVYDAHCRVLQ